MNFVHTYGKPDIPATKKFGKLVIEGINCTKFPKVKGFMDVQPDADPTVYKFTYIRYCLLPYYFNC